MYFSQCIISDVMIQVEIKMMWGVVMMHLVICRPLTLMWTRPMLNKQLLPADQRVSQKKGCKKNKIKSYMLIKA